MTDFAAGSGEPDGQRRLPQDRPVFVGRIAELAALHDGLADIGRGRGRLVLVSGEAGIGKSRLADTFAEQARESARVVWGRCWEAGGAPAYWPWVQVIRALMRTADDVDMKLDRTRDQLSTIVPELREGAAAPAVIGDPDAARFLLFDAVATTLRSASATQPTVVLLDDLHAADEPSLLLLQFLATELAEEPVMFVACYRDPELEAHDPRQALLAQLSRHPAARRVDPSALTEPEIAGMIEATTGQRAAAAMLHAIARETEGNPLFVSEVARLLADEGRLGATDDLAWRLPEGVKAVIGRRLDRLSTDCRAVLQLASVLGREFDLDLLGELGASSPEALAAIDEARLARVVQDARTGLGRWRFAHVLIRDVLYESLSLPVRTGLHDRVGRALERQVDDTAQDRLSELAHHFLLAAPGGDVERAVRYSRLAGLRATATAAHEEAVRHHRNALTALDLDRSATDADRCRLLIDLGEAQFRAGLPEARPTLRQAASLAEQLDMPDELARAAIAYGGRFVWNRAGADPMLVPLLERALAMRPSTGDALGVRILARLAGALRGDRDPDRRTALSGEAVAIARRLDDPALLVYALTAQVTAIWGPDQLDQMVRINREIEELADASGDIEQIGDSQWMQVCAGSTVGLSPELTRQILGRFEQVVERLHQPAHTWYLGVMRTFFKLAWGEYDGLEALISETREAGRRGMDWDATVSERLARFALARERDQLADVLPHVASAIVESPEYWLFDAARAYIEVEIGRLDDARRHFNVFAAAGFDTLPRDNNWLWALSHLAEVAIRLGDRPAVERLLDLLLPHSGLAASAAGEVLAGPVGRVVGDLASSLGRFDDAEAAFREGLALVARCAWRPWEGWTRLSYAEMLIRRGEDGDQEEAADHLRAATVIATELGMAALRARLDRTSADAGVVVAQPASRGAPQTRAPDADRFVREGEVWAITFEGRTMRLRDSKGLQYLARLLASPGREMPAVELATADRPVPAAGRAGLSEAGLSLGEARGDGLLDATAMRAYRDRLIDLQEEIDEADRFANTERASRLREEFDFVTRELTAATGLGGRVRTQATSAERARQSVTKAIREALDRIERQDRALGGHLRHAVRTGSMCSYEPDPRAGTRWITRPESAAGS
jgi:tetratricopeptide (TPR) repeat protein